MPLLPAWTTRGWEGALWTGVRETCPTSLRKRRPSCQPGLCPLGLLTAGWLPAARVPNPSTREATTLLKGHFPGVQFVQ